MNWWRQTAHPSMIYFSINPSFLKPSLWPLVTQSLSFFNLVQMSCQSGLQNNTPAHCANASINLSEDDKYRSFPTNIHNNLYLPILTCRRLSLQLTCYSVLAVKLAFFHWNSLEWELSCSVVNTILCFLSCHNQQKYWNWCSTSGFYLEMSINFTCNYYVISLC